jgi:hypothetical protein
MNESFAIYATCYPGVERYLPQWRESLLAQTDQDVAVHIGLDGSHPDRILEILGPHVSPQLITSRAEDTPASLRTRALLALSDEYEAVILTDMDDVLLPSRIAKAKESLASHDLYCCAMQIMDDEIVVANAIFDPSLRSEGPFESNVFGLTNTAWRSRLLRSCLPVPPDCILMDWLLATRAWGMNPRVAYDSRPQMIYRQYADNIAKILPPFGSRQILQACRVMMAHYDFVVEESERCYPHMKARLSTARQIARDFQRAVEESEVALTNYVDALNKLPLKHVWWDCVANPDLEEIWKR